ncbi:YrrS family protein [Alteribacter aurantiacus]|uniref:YrrS family protein n=1 Tax=Alteribacter aurantiacus TaxID=254410 RepID=UPI00040F7CA8|nr:YrrS family protein [Alteribacter aurantiacus]
MAQYGNYGGPNRAEMKKKQRINRLLNVAIGVVVISIFVVAGMTIFGGGSAPATTEEEQEQTENEDNGNANENINIESEEDADSDEANQDGEAREEDEESDSEFDSADSSDLSETDSNEESEEATEEEDATSEDEEGTEEEDGSEESGAADEGDWRPVGTSQSEPFALSGDSFDRSSTNWSEMMQAVQQATGLNESRDDVTLWHIGNGGNAQSAVATISERPENNTPFQVRIEWVENEGWKPVSVDKLSSNPYN